MLVLSLCLYLVLIMFCFVVKFLLASVTVCQFRYLHAEFSVSTIVDLYRDRNPVDIAKQTL